MATYPNAVDLIRVADVKGWLGAAGTPYPNTSDDMFSRVVSGVSQAAASYLQRNLQPTNYTEVRSGTGSQQMMLKNRPIISVSTLQVGNTVIAARSPTDVYSAGYVADDSSIYLDRGNHFCRGVQNVSVAYRAGYQNADTVTLPTPITEPVTTVSTWSLSKHWNSDQGVVYQSSGLTFTLVTTTPTLAGTYQLSADSGRTAEYVFSPADAGATITITYGYTPEDVVQALVELAAQRIKSRNRIGETSQVMGPSMSTSFSQSDMGPTVKMLLNPWKNVVPVL
jgi:hypothetical protein